MDLNYSLIIISLIALIAKLSDARKVLKPSDIWTQQNFVFDKNALLGTDIVNEEHLFFPEDLRSDLPVARQGPVAQLLICIFRGCPSPPPIIVQPTPTTTEQTTTTRTTTTTRPTTTTTRPTTTTTTTTRPTTTTSTRSTTTSSMRTTTPFASNLIPTGRRRRPIRFQINGYCNDPPTKHVRDRFTKDNEDNSDKEPEDDSESED